MRSHMKKFKQKLLYVTILFLLAMMGCAPATSMPISSNISINVASFQENYPMLLGEAQKWRADAYLESARVFLYPEFSDIVINAGFFSASEGFESLGVDILKDGTIITKIYSHQYPISHQASITGNDWKIDSPEALEIMLDEEGRRYINSGKGGCSDLWLRRIAYLKNQPVIWSLAQSDCTDFTKYFYLDANSGELIDSSIINTQPTRIPTTQTP